VRPAILLHRGADGGDLDRGGPTAAADDPGAEVACVRRELGEVLGRRVRKDHPSAGEAREADVRQRCEDGAVPTHLFERGERCQQACAVVRAESGNRKLGQTLRGLRGRHACERLRVLVEGHQGHDRQAGDAPNRLDGVDELLEVVERLDHEQVGAAALQHAGLLGEELASHPRRGGLAQRSDRARDEDVATGDLSRLACVLRAGRVDALELVLEEVGRQLPPVGAERVRLDQLGTGVDEADVQRHDGLGRPQIRLLRTAQPGHRGRDQGAHPAVTHNGGARAESFQEAALHRNGA
jgi:hypothetical protein